VESQATGCSGQRFDDSHRIEFAKSAGSQLVCLFSLISPRRKVQFSIQSLFGETRLQQPEQEMQEIDCKK
jgi:hypothetical protein